MTVYEASYGKPWGCLVVEYLKPEQRSAGKNTDKARKGMFYGYEFHKGYSACQVQDPSTGRIQFVPHSQLKFERDCFPYSYPAGQQWQPMEIPEITDEPTILEKGEHMHPLISNPSL
eukprot:3485486-Rhodomonas_salina.2